MIPSSFACHCSAKKTRRLAFDGGILGHYHLELCNSCYVVQDKKFLIKEEIINERTK